MRRLSIPTRIFLGFALVLTVFVAVALGSVWQHQNTAATLRRLHDGYLPLALTVGELRATQNVFGTLLDRVLDERDSTATRSWIAVARRVRPAALRRAVDGVELAERYRPPAAEQQMLDDVRTELGEVSAAYSAGDAQYEALFQALVDRDLARAEAALAELRARERIIDRGLRRASTRLQQGIEEASASAELRERQSVEVLAGLLAAALLVGLAITWLAQRVLAPLPRLQERVAAVARGDLAARLEPARDDELGRLATEFERMVDAIGARDARLREAAARLERLQRVQQQIVADLRAAVVVVDGARIVRSANPAAAQLLGLGAPAIGRALETSGLLDRLPGLAHAVEEVAEGAPRASLVAAPLYADTAHAAEADAARRHVDVLVTPFDAGAADPEGHAVLVVAEDVTEELATKARLIQTERLAAIGRMAAHVTHEVRNPLSSIGLNVEMLEEETRTAGPETKALLRSIQKEVDRLTEITEEYLRVARLPAPRLENEDLGVLVADIARFVEPELREHGCTITTDIASELPPVAFDEAQIRQAMLNLLRNAREAMPQGGTIAVAVQPDAGGVALRVKDQGVGLSEEARTRMFELFFTTKERGTGLGLPLTVQIVIAHGGRMSCDSAPGEGTTFTLWLPTAGAEAAVETRDGDAPLPPTVPLETTP